MARRYSDYGSYLATVKSNNLGTYLSNQNFVQLTERIDTIRKPAETLYVSPSASNEVEIDPIASMTILAKPVDNTGPTPAFSCVMRLPANSTIPNGTVKTIVNTCEITSTTPIYIYSKNTETNLGGFNGNFNCYVIPAAYDTLELCWISATQLWFAKRYGFGGHFINIDIT
jgi:hypothetical protein